MSSNSPKTSIGKFAYAQLKKWMADEYLKGLPPKEIYEKAAGEFGMHEWSIRNRISVADIQAAVRKRYEVTCAQKDQH